MGRWLDLNLYGLGLKFAILFAKILENVFIFWGRPGKTFLCCFYIFKVSIKNCFIVHNWFYLIFKALAPTNFKRTRLIREQSVFGVFPKSPTHRGLYFVKNSATNSSCLGHFQMFFLWIQVGFARCETVAIPSHSSRGFQRPLQVFSKVNSQSQAVSGAAHPFSLSETRITPILQIRNCLPITQHKKTLRSCMHIHTPFRARPFRNQDHSHSANQKLSSNHTTQKNTPFMHAHSHAIQPMSKSCLANQERAYPSSQSEARRHARFTFSQAGIHHQQGAAARPIRSEQHTH